MRRVVPELSCGSLNRSRREILDKGGATLAALYQNLTGSNTAAADFTGLLDKHFPFPAPAGGFGAVSDNAFPLLDPADRGGTISFRP